MLRRVTAALLALLLVGCAPGASPEPASPADTASDSAIAGPARLLLALPEGRSGMRARVLLVPVRAG
ncbi:MAG: hypothetical protein AB2385_06290 [Symbiobacterium sp.]|uniref:hypothetical protein n=1 Tax=Symbiobacterium sp. TaxID=1971213 RepID=UPI0034642749